MTSSDRPTPAIADIDAITFDCYGTLIDWEAGLLAFFRRLLVRKMVSVPAEELLRVWEPIQFKMIQQSYRRYREILAASLEEALRQIKVRLDPEDGRQFAPAMSTWRPFRDVPPALARLRTKYRLGIISNTDRDLIARTLTYFGVPFDVVVTAQDVRTYKPSTKGFEEALARLAVPPERVLHAAFGVKYDLEPARRVGMKRCFVKRGSMAGPVDPPPDLEVVTIGELADVMGV